MIFLLKKKKLKKNAINWKYSINIINAATQGTNIISLDHSLLKFKENNVCDIVLILIYSWKHFECKEKLPFK